MGWLSGILAVWAAGCMGSTPVENSREPLRITAVTYNLTWELGRARRTAEGWQVTTDRGYTVEVTAGRLSTHTVTLVPCVAQASLLEFPPLFGSGVALAGHSGKVDISTWLNPPVEDLAQLAVAAPHRVWFPPANYCEMHLLVARPPGSVPGKPSGATLEVEGTWRRGEGETGPLVIHTTLANGVLRPLGPLTVREGELTVNVSRDISRLFDGIQFGEDKAAQVERQVLVNLIDGISVTGSDPHGAS